MSFPTRVISALTPSRAWIRDQLLALSLVLLSLIIALLLLWPRIVVTIRSGEAGILFQRFGGTDTSHIYSEGIHLIAPWDIIYVYNLRMATVQRQFSVLSSTGLPMDLTVSIRYRADARTLVQLHTNVGPDYLDKVVIPETEAVLRRFAGQFTPEELYASRAGVLESVLLNAYNQSEQRYVSIDNVMLQSIKLPDDVQAAINKKESLEQDRQSYAIKIEIEKMESERKRIQAQGDSDAQRIVQQTLTEDTLRWEGIKATRDLASSTNAKTLIIGGKDNLPLIMNGDR